MFTPSLEMIDQKIEASLPQLSQAFIFHHSEHFLLLGHQSEDWSHNLSFEQPFHQTKS